MPGTRKHEVANLIPFFVQTALRLRASRPEIPVAFAISPFTTEAELAAAFASGGDPNVWGARGRVEASERGLALAPADGSAPFPIVRDAMRYAPHARLVVTLPGTKCIELAALGVPALVCVPLNAPEAVVINGPLQYLDRIPVAGRLLKRAMVVRVDASFKLTAQPNIDTGESLMPELRGTLMPGEVARRIARYYDDEPARSAASARLRELYVAHAGAAERLARSLLEAAS
jgi:lipid A disaccharide synthetase